MIIRTILIKLFMLYNIAAQGQGVAISCDNVNPDVAYRARYIQYESGNYYRNSLSDKPNNSFLNNSIRWYSPAGSLQMNFHPHDRNGKTSQTT